MLVPLLVLIGCEKTNDMPHLQDEALAMAKRYQQRFDDLAHRAEAINPASLGTTEVQRVYQQARSALVRYRNDVRQVAPQVQTAAKTGNPDELRKLVDAKRAWFEGGVMEATAQVAAVESWLDVAKQRHMTPQAPTEIPATVPAGDVPDDLGSDAPIR